MSKTRKKPELVPEPPKIDTAPPTDLESIVNQSKQALTDIQAPKNKGGRPKGYVKGPDGKWIDSTVKAPLVTPVPGPAAPMLAEAYGGAIMGLAGYMKRDFSITEEEKKSLGDQTDIVIQYYLPDLEKNPKLLAVYMLLFSISMVGVRIVKAPLLLNTKQTIKDSSVQSKPEIQPEPVTKKTTKGPEPTYKPEEPSIKTQELPPMMANEFFGKLDKGL